MPRSWNDVGARPFDSPSISFVDPIAGDGSEDDRGEDCFADSGVVVFMCADVVCFALFDGTPSSLCEVPSCFLFWMGDIFNLTESAHSKVGFWASETIRALALIDKGH